MSFLRGYFSYIVQVPYLKIETIKDDFFKKTVRSDSVNVYQ